jgi:hypothetical protein
MSIPTFADPPPENVGEHLLMASDTTAGMIRLVQGVDRRDYWRSARSRSCTALLSPGIRRAFSYCSMAAAA